ncbi:MAG TPA: ATP-grasp domain-containing protein [Jatrophihabitantaceae bacterium]|nr:ATP-grasp domain-containing protein [Jatrophihabitantaceae bacterium]
MKTKASMQIVFLALNPTDSVTQGFLPAAGQLGASVVLLTDSPDAHARAYADQPDAPAAILGCDVRDPFAVIAALSRRPRPDAVFTNSDHLQTQAALAASYLGLPGKDWTATLRTKNKALMRRALVDLDPVFSAELGPKDDPAMLDGVRFPCVVKPREGVASEDVVRADDPDDLLDQVHDIRTRRPDQTLVVEEFLDGPLHTLETIGDAGGRLHVLGGFQTQVSPPPYFIEERMDWRADLPESTQQQLRAQLAALGVGLGACHTEFVLQDDRPRLIEVNYRIIGDQCDLLLADLFEAPLFEWVLLTHLGEDAPTPEPTRRHARIDYIYARTGGVLREAPPAMDTAGLCYRPLRPVGDTVTLTHTNRDYLGVLRTIGDNPTTVDAGADAFLSAHRWDVRP